MLWSQPPLRRLRRTVNRRAFNGESEVAPEGYEVLQSPSDAWHLRLQRVRDKRAFAPEHSGVEVAARSYYPRLSAPRDFAG